MTVVAYDGKSIAADRRSTWDNEPTPHGTTKLRLLRHGKRRFAVAHAGVMGNAYRMLEHVLFGYRTAGVLAPYDRGNAERSALMIVELLPDDCHKVTLVDYDGGETDVTDEPAAIGSGQDYAMGAMHAGADALTAVRIAAKLNTSCGDGETVHQIAALHQLPLSQFASITGES